MPKFSTFSHQQLLAPLVSVDVERSFSRFKAFFRSNRHRFLDTSIEKHMVIICNPRLNKSVAQCVVLYVFASQNSQKGSDLAAKYPPNWPLFWRQKATKSGTFI